MASPISDSSDQNADGGFGLATLPSSEYKVVFRGGSVTMLDVHPGQDLRGKFAEMLAAAGYEVTDVVRVEHYRAYDADAEFAADLAAIDGLPEESPIVVSEMGDVRP